ncbi:hypothetical protein KFK09_024150 [Dendrobium nobile]|uniref:Transmembrane protein n=1 Tax=Dendrobium nobile TaxID=94219 RepID=A0A8T3AD21_DENNO|nr:hypothetical protein KFK09_024150 [Dendrobium nobile]
MLCRPSLREREMIGRMETKVIVICGTVGFLGLVSAALGFSAEATRVKASDVVIRIPGQCRYPDSPTVFLGLASAIAVVIAQATISIIAGCICCKRNANTSDTNWTVALISFVASWITFIIAFLLLLTGVALNDLKSVDQNNFDDYCYIVKPGVFSGGAIFSLASVSLGILYYLALQPSKTSQPMCLPQNQSITFGKPQIPLQSTQLAFVHEDTYTRQQIP